MRNPSPRIEVTCIPSWQRCHWGHWWWKSGSRLFETQMELTPQQAIWFWKRCEKHYPRTTLRLRSCLKKWRWRIGLKLLSWVKSMCRINQKESSAEVRLVPAGSAWGWGRPVRYLFPLGWFKCYGKVRPQRALYRHSLVATRSTWTCLSWLQAGSGLITRCRTLDDQMRIGEHKCRQSESAFGK